MRKLGIILSISLVMTCNLTACQSNKIISETQKETTTSRETQVATITSMQEREVPEFDGVIFTYNGIEYDISERTQLVNSIMEVDFISEDFLIYGHINPNVIYYGIFDTEVNDFEAELYGTNLIWHSDDISTAIYYDWTNQMIYDYDGNVIAELELSENDMVEEIQFINNNTEIEVKIYEEGQGYIYKGFSF